MPKNYYKNKNFENLVKQAGNKRDEFSPFRNFITKCKTRKKEYNIDVKYLKELWENQNGICPYTGIKMELSQTTDSKHTNNSLKKASLDRIDSTKGYVKGNVEFVCLFINFAKNGYSKTQVISFLKECNFTKIGGADGS